VSARRERTSERTDAALASALADVKAEIARTDNKVALLLAFNGAVLAGAWTVASGLRLSLAARLAGGAGLLLLVVAAGVLLAAVRPNLGGGANGTGFPKWAALTARDLRTELRRHDTAEHVTVLSRIALAKFARLRQAVDLTFAAGVLLLVAVVVAVGGAL
jgi:hypothetical protein